MHVENNVLYICRFGSCKEYVLFKPLQPLTSLRNTALSLYMSGRFYTDSKKQSCIRRLIMSVNVRGAMNCATTNGFYLNEKLFFRNGIISIISTHQSGHYMCENRLYGCRFPLFFWGSGTFSNLSFKWQDDFLLIIHLKNRVIPN